MHSLQPAVAREDRDTLCPWNLWDIALYGVLVELCLAVLVLGTSGWLFLSINAGIAVWLHWRCDVRI